MLLPPGRAWGFYEYSCKKTLGGQCFSDERFCTAQGGAWHPGGYCGARTLGIGCGCCVGGVTPAPTPRAQEQAVVVVSTTLLGIDTADFGETAQFAYRSAVADEAGTAVEAVALENISVGATKRRQLGSSSLTFDVVVTVGGPLVAVEVEVALAGVSAADMSRAFLRQVDELQGTHDFAALPPSAHFAAVGVVVSAVAIEVLPAEAPGAGDSGSLGHAPDISVEIAAVLSLVAAYMCWSQCKVACRHRAKESAVRTPTSSEPANSNPAMRSEVTKGKAKPRPSQMTISSVYDTKLDSKALSVLGAQNPMHVHVV